MKAIFISSVLISFLLLAGCSSPQEKKSAGDETYDEYEIADPSASSGSEQKVHTVEIRQMQFEPPVLNINKGDKVIWVNKDIVEHDITEESSKAWASSKLPAGASWSMTITKSELYYCNLHVVMKGKIIVDGKDIAMIETPAITMCR
jgi:plastocyanin